MVVPLQSALHLTWGLSLLRAVQYLAHSLALFADAGHNLSDVLGLLLAGLGKCARPSPLLQNATLTGCVVLQFWLLC